MATTVAARRDAVPCRLLLLCVPSFPEIGQTLWPTRFHRGTQDCPYVLFVSRVHDNNNINIDGINDIIIHGRTSGKQRGSVTMCMVRAQEKENNRIQYSRPECGIIPWWSRRCLLVGAADDELRSSLKCIDTDLPQPRPS